MNYKKTRIFGLERKNFNLQVACLEQCRSNRWNLCVAEQQLARNRKVSFFEIQGLERCTKAFSKVLLNLLRHLNEKRFLNFSLIIFTDWIFRLNINVPMIFAAVDAPTIMERFGAMNAILLSTYSNIFCLQLFNSTAMSQASQIASFSSSVNSCLIWRKL